MKRFEVLFRFRDLVAPTLERHRQVIRDKGSCWWGWWKRPSEGARMDVWDLLEKEIARDKVVTVGLFHSGDGIVQTARVVEVIKPTDDRASSPPDVPAGERELIPEYYRNSVFSRAWMRFSEISTETVADFFARYAYGEPPPLPKIPPQLLEKLKAKRVVDPDELRAMDTTIWLVQEAASGADSSHFLAPSWRVIESVSNEPISLKGSKILHLSDIHYDQRSGSKCQHRWSRTGSKPMHEVVASALSEQQKREIGLLIISGDLTFCASETEFDQSTTSLQALMGILDLGPEHVVVCPGNHDIKWTKDAESFEDGKDIEPEVSPPEANQQYEKFYRTLLQHSPNSDLSMGRRYVLPHGRVLEVCALNSTSLAAGDSYLPGMGRIGPNAFEDVRAKMGWSKEVPNLSLRMLVLHHHVVQTEDVENPAEYRKGFGLAIDAQKTLREAAKAGFRMVLHGHRHRAFYWRAGVHELPEVAHESTHCGNLAIIGAGSAGSTDTPDSTNFFGLIDIQPRVICSTMYRSQKGSAFGPLQRWHVDINSDDRGLVVSDWQTTAAGAPLKR